MTYPADIIYCGGEMGKEILFRGPLSHASGSKDTEKKGTTRGTLCANGQHYLKITLCIVFLIG